MRKRSLRSIEVPSHGETSDVRDPTFRQARSSRAVDTPATAPSDEQALAALRTLRAWLGLGAAASATFDSDHLPPGITRDAFLRRHRQRWRAGVAGWTRVGQMRVVTVEAWDRYIDQEGAISRARSTRATRLRPAVVPATTIGEQLDSHLGIRTRRRAS